MDNDFKSNECEFGLVDSPQAWAGIRELRLQMYMGKRNYLNKLVNPQGYDEYDEHSHIFFAKYRDKYVASVRLTQFPFETSKYLSHDTLIHYLGSDYERNYLEVGRLVVACNTGLQSLTNAILGYAVSQVTAVSDRKSYIAYANPRLKQKAFKFLQASEVQKFQIPDRRESEYVLFKGEFNEELGSSIRKFT